MTATRRSIHLACLMAVGIAFAFQPQTVLGVDPVTAGASVAGLKSLVGDLEKLAEDAASAGDQLLQNRIEQAVTGLQVVLARVNEAVKSGKADVNDIIDEAMGDATGLLGELHDDVSTIGSFAGTKLSLVMANATNLYDKVPFLNADPAVFAIVPSRISSSAKGAQVRVFGYLPGDLEDDVHVTANGVQIPKVSRGSGGSLVFSLPGSLALKEEELVSLNIQIDKHYGPFDVLWKTHSFDETILVGQTKAIQMQCRFIR